MVVASWCFILQSKDQTILERNPPQSENPPWSPLSDTGEEERPFNRKSPAVKQGSRTLNSTFILVDCGFSREPLCWSLLLLSFGSTGGFSGSLESTNASTSIFSIILRENYCISNNAAQMKESNPTYLFNVHVEEHILTPQWSLPELWEALAAWSAYPCQYTPEH